MKNHLVNSCYKTSPECAPTQTDVLFTVCMLTSVLHCLCVLYLWDLCGCVASGSQHHHSQSWRDAERGEEDICGLVFIQLFEQSQREGGVSLGQRGWCLQLLWLHCFWCKERREQHESLHYKVDDIYIWLRFYFYLKAQMEQRLIQRGHELCVCNSLTYIFKQNEFTVSHTRMILNM